MRVLTSLEATVVVGELISVLVRAVVSVGALVEEVELVTPATEVLLEVSVLRSGAVCAEALVEVAGSLWATEVEVLVEGVVLSVDALVVDCDEAGCPA